MNAGQTLSARNDPREVVADAHARYFGTEPGERTLVPGDGALHGEMRFKDWLSPTEAPPMARARSPAFEVA